MRTIAEEGPRQGQIGVQPTPLATGISPTLQSETGKLTPSIGEKFADLIGRKIVVYPLVRLLLFALALSSLCIGATLAQTGPYVHAGTLGTSSVQVLGFDQSRTSLTFWNPNPSATLAFCPAGPNRDTGLPVTCAVNGAGSVSLPPGNHFTIDASGGTSLLSMPSPWLGAASAPGATYTITEP
jgi:hypothetical protein